MNFLMISAVSIRFAMRPQLEARSMCVKQFFLLGKHLFSPIRLFGRAAGMEHRIIAYMAYNDYNGAIRQSTNISWNTELTLDATNEKTKKKELDICILGLMNDGRMCIRVRSWFSSLDHVDSSKHCRAAISIPQAKNERGRAPAPEHRDTPTEPN